MKIFHFTTFLAVLLILASCSKRGSDDKGAIPENFDAIGDTARVAFMIQNVEPDSVARFICYGALGRSAQGRIDSLGIATSYAYEKYTGQELVTFADEYENFVASLQLPEKMKMYAMAGVEDPQKLGLQLGLEYMQQIRDKNLSVEQVEKELRAFKKACGDDEQTYKRFIIGFHTVLEADNGHDMPRAIYEKFINYE